MTAPFDLDTVDRLLSTTRAVRRRLDCTRPVERSVILDCIRLSQQAPTGSNAQTWRWVVVTDADKRRAIGEIYGRGLPAIREHGKAIPEADVQSRQVYAMAEWFAERVGDVPVHVIPCVVGRPPARFEPTTFSTIYGSIFPAVWSFQLALRSRGLGSVLTTLHLPHAADVAAVLGIPDDVLQVALLPVAYTKGTEFKPARRPPAESITTWDGWRW